MAGIYIHIPFCASRCSYCAFYSTTRSDLRPRYVDAVCRELAARKSELPSGEVIETVYFGGGTPSQLTIGELQKILQQIGESYPSVSESSPFTSDSCLLANEQGSLTTQNHSSGSREGSFQPPQELTLECNPDDVTPTWCDALVQTGINRVSLGAQSFSDSRLKIIGRRHSRQQIDDAVACLRNAGVKNISIDLMFGFPEETMAEWEYDLRQAIALDVEHISAYSLTYEEGTPLSVLRAKKRIAEIDESLSVAMYDRLIDRLTDADYEHYEVSNFARKGFRSRHNSSYWHGIPYIGVGAAAHSYNRTTRRWNISDANRYAESVMEGRFDDIFDYEIIDETTAYNDIITTALRTSDGIDLQELENRLGRKFCQYLSANARKAIEAGTLIFEKGHLSLTRKGLFVSDTVMTDLIMLPEY